MAFCQWLGVKLKRQVTMQVGLCDVDGLSRGNKSTRDRHHANSIARIGVFARTPLSRLAFDATAVKIDA